jgi:hypothetical protein
MFSLILIHHLSLTYFYSSSFFIFCVFVFSLMPVLKLTLNQTSSLLPDPQHEFARPWLSERPQSGKKGEKEDAGEEISPILYLNFISLPKIIFVFSCDLKLWKTFREDGAQKNFYVCFEAAAK